MSIVTLRNKATGQFIELDTVKERLGRMRRRVGEWARNTQEFNKGKYRIVMVTLTYKRDGMWRANHIRDFMTRMRGVLKSKLLAYAWVAELTEGGRVHYHVLLVVPRGVLVPAPDAGTMKTRLWKHGSSRTETARTVWYVVKYLSKGHHMWKTFPHRMRLYAVVIYKDAPLSDEDRFNFKLTAWPSKVRAAAREMADLLEGFDLVARRVPGGWYIEGGLHEVYLRAEYEYIPDSVSASSSSKAEGSK